MNKSRVSGLAGALRRTFVVALLLAFCSFAAVGRAAVISPGSPTTTVPTDLDDPLGSLTSPLPADQFLLPIVITGTNGLQDWIFDLTFDGSVVTLLDVGGLFQSVYAAHFNAIDNTLSGITTSGFPGPDVLAGISGFSSGVSGDGLLAFVLFEFQPGQSGNEPNFGIANAIITQQAPAPGTLLLLIPALAALRLRRTIARKIPLPNRA